MTSLPSHVEALVDWRDAELARIAAFSDGSQGGNPAGVVIARDLPSASEMQAIAAEVGYSETAFAAPREGGWRVRYFAPEAEIDFCGHATIALGAELVRKYGAGQFVLSLNRARITVEGRPEEELVLAALQSPPTDSRPASAEVIDPALALFDLQKTDLDPRLPPGVAHGGMDHLVLPLASRERLAAMHYDLEDGRAFMLANGFATISLVFMETACLLYARNAFAIGGVLEDPATGAAAAALAGYLRDLNWPGGSEIVIHQGDDMGMPCRLMADIPREKGASVRVSGTARFLPNA